MTLYLRRAFKHAAVICSLLLLTLIIPYLTVTKVYGGASVDSVSSATSIVEADSGQYVTLINCALHQDEKLDAWRCFFSGEDAGVIFEDVVCEVSDTDPGGYDCAVSFMSRLPENQLKLKKTDATLLISKIRWGIFDVSVMSKEFYDNMKLSKLSGLSPVKTEVVFYEKS